MNLLTNYYNNNLINNFMGNQNQNFSININKVKDSNHNFYNYNNIISNDINNYNNFMNNSNNLSLSLNQNTNNNNINLVQVKNNGINAIDFIPNLSQISSLNGINGINMNNINEINNICNINNLNSINNEFNDNITNLSHNLSYCNSVNQINTINNTKNNIINNNINCINIIQNNFIESNLNNNNLMNNIFIQNNNNQNNTNNNMDLFSNNEKLFKNENDLGKNSLEDFIKYLRNLSMPLLEFLCTPKGTLEIQKKLGNSNTESKILLIKLLNKEGLTIIMKNIYGNYFFQQIIKGAEEIIISLIISYISDNFIEISKDSSGTFSIQALLNEVSSVKGEQQILNCIKDQEMVMAFNKNATYVIQKIVLLFPDIHRTNLNEVILNNLKDLCLDSNGICLIKNFIKTNTLMSNKTRIMEEILNNFVILAESPFGNYGIQYLMENWNKYELNDIKNKIIENIYKLSIQQFSSNVVEKAIEIFDDESRETMIKKICFDSNFIILLKNKFGRFVLHKAINYMKDELKKKFEIYLINNINNNVYNNRDRNKVRKFLMKIKNNKLQSDFNFVLNKEHYVRNNMGNNCNYNIKKNTNNSNFGNNSYFL